MAITESKLREIIKEECELTVEKQRLRNIIKEEYQAVLSEQSIESFFPNYQIPPELQNLVRFLEGWLKYFPGSEEPDWEGSFFPMAERVIGEPVKKEFKNPIIRIWKHIVNTVRPGGISHSYGDQLAGQDKKPARASDSWVGKSMREVIKIVKAELKKLKLDDDKMTAHRDRRHPGKKPVWMWGGLMSLKNNHPLRRKYKEWYQDARKRRRAKRKRK